MKTTEKRIEGIAIGGGSSTRPDHAIGVLCPGAAAKWEQPWPHEGSRRIYHAGHGWWECAGCMRTFSSEEVLQHQP
jgi:hypothetical protein